MNISKLMLPSTIKKEKSESSAHDKIICRVTKFKEKQEILKSAKLFKNTSIFIYEHFHLQRHDGNEERTFARSV